VLIRIGISFSSASGFFIIAASADLTPLVLSLTLAIILGLNVLIFYLHDNLKKLVFYAKEKEYYLTQCQLMQESAMRTRAMRHDMRFHLATVRSYVAKNQLDETMGYLNKLLSDIDDCAIYSNTGNIAIDSIINFKLRNANLEGFRPDIRLLIPSVLYIETAHLATIIGNLLDNAIEAVARAEEKKIKLDIEFNRGSLYIQLDNTFDGIIKRTEQGNITTRKNNENRHGFGLKNIQRSVEKYNGHMEITHVDKIFSVTILLLATNDIEEL